MKHIPFVSFIIPTLNAATGLEKCLHSISTQNYPTSKIEIIVVDGDSTDSTLKVAKKYNATVIHNPHVFQEPGKTLGSKVAKGDILFYLDSDNILVSNNWIKTITEPYIKEKNIAGMVPITVPPVDGGILNKYFGYLFTDPFTYYVYGNAANPQDYGYIYSPLKVEPSYTIYTFSNSFPLFGYAQGVGVIKKFAHGAFEGKDDMLSGIDLLKRGGNIAIVSNAQIYHYHVSSISKFIKKYTWRTRNNLYQTKQNIGLRNRTQYLTYWQKLRMALFIPYSFSIIFPVLEASRLVIKYRDVIMFIHFPLTLLLASIMTKEIILFFLQVKQHVGTYE